MSESKAEILDMLRDAQEKAEAEEALNILRDVVRITNDKSKEAYVVNNLDETISNANPYNQSIESWIKEIEEQEEDVCAACGRELPLDWKDGGNAECRCGVINYVCDTCDAIYAEKDCEESFPFMCPNCMTQRIGA